MAIETNGGKDPFEIKTWKDALKAEILAIMRISYSTTVSGLYDHFVYKHIGCGPPVIHERFEHTITEQELKETLKEMYVADWIEIAAYHCENCEKFFSKDKMVAFDHATRIRLTAKEYNKRYGIHSSVNKRG